MEASQYGSPHTAVNAVNKIPFIHAVQTAAVKDSQPAVVPPSPPAPSGGNKGLAAGAAVAAAVAFAAVRLFSGGPSLASLEKQAVPLEVALRNGKPTVLEFYANW